MRKQNPLLALHEALASALLRDLSDIRYQTRDWVAEDVLKNKMTKEERAAYRTNEVPMLKEAMRRPTADDVSVDVFSQLWSSTALGYGGIGGAAMTSAYTIVASTEKEACVYFGGGRLAYRVEYASMSEEQRNCWLEALAERQMPSRRDAKRLFGAVEGSAQGSQPT